MSENVFLWCKDNKDLLLTEKANGNTRARNIVAVHDMYINHPDHAALAILEELVSDWKKQEAHDDE